MKNCFQTDGSLDNLDLLIHRLLILTFDSLLQIKSCDKEMLLKCCSAYSSGHISTFISFNCCNLKAIAQGYHIPDMGYNLCPIIISNYIPII